MKTILFLIVIVSCSYSSGWDTTIVIKKDMTYDGIHDNIQLSISLKDWSSPAIWSVKIESQGKIIYDIQVTDVKLDSSFYDTLFVTDCENYFNCKRKWYKEKYNNFTGELFDGEKRGGGEYSIYTNMIEKYFQDKEGVSKQRSKEMALSFKSFFNKRKIVFFSIPYSPVDYSALMTWDVQTKKFIPWFAP